ncbi:Aim23p [Sporobolomyces koalae]|uniref:Aim23p n=1 Tax=Sporobolomyces koalae TaxID=500713 RepID=UPI00316B6810
MPLPARSLARLQHPPCRPFSAGVITLKGAAKSGPPLKGSKIFRDEDIPHSTIVLVDPATKSLLPPSTLSSLLAALDRTRYAIQLVDPASEPPICRILDKKEAYQKARDKKAKDAERAANQVANAGGELKEVHLTWGVSEHDLEHKLKKGRELLAKGNRLLIGLSDKKRAVKVSQEVRAQVVKQVEEALSGYGTLKGRPTTRDGAVWLEFSRIKS